MKVETNSLKRRTLVMAAFAVVVIVAMAGYQVWQGYRMTVTAANRDLTELRAVLAESTGATLRSAEIMVDRAVLEVLRLGPNPNIQLLSQRLIEDSQNWRFVYAQAYISADAVGRIAIRRNDGDGKMVPTIPVERAVDEVFTVHVGATRESDRFYVSKPFLYRQGGIDIVAMSKGVFDAEGKFLGVCIVGIRLDTFTQLLSTLLPAHVRSAALRRTDGSLLISTLSDVRIEEIQKAPTYTTWPPPTPGVVHHMAPMLPRELILAYQQVGTYPIVISVAAYWADVLAPWKRSAAAAIATALVGMILIAGLTRGIIKRLEDQQRAQREVLKNERSLAESQRLSGIAHFERNLDSPEILWGENMYAVHGVDRETFVPNYPSFLALVAPEDRERVLEASGSLENPKRYGRYECRMNLPSGEVKFMRYSWEAVDDGTATPMRIFGVAQDMTAIRRAEDIIREDQERLRDIVECSSDYIWESDADGQTTFFTGPQAHKFRGPDGRQPKILHGVPANAGDAKRLNESVRSRSRLRSLTVPWTDTAGERHHIRISANPRFDAALNFLGYRGTATEVTDVVRRREDEENTRRSEALGRLASGLAHEINNLLQPIMIYSAFGTSEAGVTQSVRQYFGRIATAAERASHIVKNVLAFARRGHLPQEFVNPVDVARESIDLLSGALKPGVKITFETQTDKLQVRVNRTGLAQVITNLLANATDALKEGGRATVTVASADLGGDASLLGLSPGLYYRISVEDNGPGISSAHLSEIFEPFFTTKPQGQGTGLGLSVVAGLVKSWGGTVKVDSAPGDTTCFTIYLPLADRHLQAAQ